MSPMTDDDLTGVITDYELRRDARARQAEARTAFEARDATKPMAVHQPGDPHAYETLCCICGVRGYLHVSIEPQFAAIRDASPSDGGAE